MVSKHDDLISNFLNAQTKRDGQRDRIYHPISLSDSESEDEGDFVSAPTTSSNTTSATATNETENSMLSAAAPQQNVTFEKPAAAEATASSADTSNGTAPTDTKSAPPKNPSPPKVTSKAPSKSSSNLPLGRKKKSSKSVSSQSYVPMASTLKPIEEKVAWKGNQNDYEEDLTNHPNRALFDILNRTLNNEQLLQEKSNNTIVIQNTEAKAVLRIIQLCFSSMAVTFTSNPTSPNQQPLPSNNNKNKSSSSQKNMRSNINSNEFVMLKQSPHLESLQSIHAPIITNPQDFFNMRALIGDSTHTQYSSKQATKSANMFDVKDKIMTAEIQASLMHRPFVPNQVVYELWKELLRLSSSRAKKNKNKDVMDIKDLNITVNKNANRNMEGLDQEIATLEHEITDEERDILAKLFLPEERDHHNHQHVNGDDSDNEYEEDEDEEDYEEKLQEGMEKCCDFFRDILVHLGLLEVITVSADAEQNKLSATVTGAASVTSTNTGALSIFQNDAQSEVDADNMTIATGLSDWAGADEFSLFSTSLLSTTKSVRAATFGRIKEQNEDQVKVVFEPESSQEDAASFSSPKSTYSNFRGDNNKAAVRHVFFRINHDITQDYGVHLARTKFLSPPAAANIPVQNSGFDDREDDESGTVGTIATPDPRKNDPTLRWNRVLVKALLLRGNMPLEDQIQAIISNPSELDDKKTVFTSFTKMTDQRTPIDIHIMYAVRMLPRHMIHAALLSDAAKCMRDARFVQTRLLSMGMLEGVIRQRRDCQELEESVFNNFQSKQHKHALEEEYKAFQNNNPDASNSGTSSGVVGAGAGGSPSPLENHSMLYHAQNWAKRVAMKSFELASLNIHQSADLIMSNQSKKSHLINMKKASVLANDLGQALHTLGVCFGEHNMLRLEMSHYEYAYRLKKTILGERHISVAETLHCLGAVHQTRGDSYRAMKCYQDSLEILRPSMGEDSLGVANIMHNIGVVYCGTGEYETAMTIFEESLRVRRLKLGDNHEDISDTIQWIGKVHRELGDYDNALKHFKAAHYGKEARFGKENIAVAECLNNLGTIHDDLGNQEESLACYRESLLIKKRLLGVDHPDVAESLQNIANVYKDMKKHGKALACFKECVKILEMKMSLSLSQGSRKGMHNNLEECYQNVITLTKMKVGDDHSDVAHIYLNLGHFHDKLNQYEGAIDAYEEALRIWRIEIDHVNISLVLNAMGVVHAKRNFHEKAMSCFDEALYIRKKRLGEDSLLVATVYHNIGNTHAKKRDYEKAMNCYNEGKHICLSQVISFIVPLIFLSSK